jgi:CDP-paratose synthetase
MNLNLLLFKKNMKLLISGATGFIGKHLVTRLLQEGHDIHIIVPLRESQTSIEGTTVYAADGKINNLISFFQKNRFDGVIHLASLFLAQHTSDDIMELINSNVLFGTSLLEAAVKNGVSWFINTGTFWQHFQNNPYSPVNLYAATKQAFEDIARYYFETTNLNFVTLKLCDTFGPNDTRKKIFNLWAQIGKTGESLDMSAGEQIIDISYIDNIIDGYVRLIKLLTDDDAKKLNGRSFAMKANERMTLKELAKLFEKTTRVKLNINWGKKEYRPREVMVPWESGEIIPGWKQKIPLAEGINKTFNPNF